MSDRPEEKSEPETNTESQQASGESKNLSRKKRSLIDVPDRENIGPDGNECEEFK